MQTTEYSLKYMEDDTRYVVHHDSRCAGWAIFTITEDLYGDGRKSKLIAETAASIEDVERTVLTAQFASRLSTRSTYIDINGVNFELEGLVSILRELAFERIAVKLEDNGKCFSLEDIVKLEENIDEVITSNTPEEL
jgi:hypothetical protein